MQNVGNPRQWHSDRITGKSEARFIIALFSSYIRISLSSSTDFYKYKTQRKMLVRKMTKTCTINTFLLWFFSYLTYSLFRLFFCLKNIVPDDLILPRTCKASTSTCYDRSKARSHGMKCSKYVLNRHTASHSVWWWLWSLRRRCKICAWSKTHCESRSTEGLILLSWKADASQTPWLPLDVEPQLCTLYCAPHQGLGDKSCRPTQEAVRLF